jgi:hypothetical protein
MQADPTLAEWNAEGPTPDRGQFPRPDEARWHGTILAGVVLFLTAGLLCKVEPDQSIGLSAVPTIKLPMLCPSRLFFGVECPGCGVTRSLTHLLHGRFGQSFATHRLGWLVFAVILFQIPYRTWRLAGHTSPFDKPRVAMTLLWGFAALLIANWLLPRNL